MTPWPFKLLQAALQLLALPLLRRVILGLRAVIRHLLDKIIIGCDQTAAATQLIQCSIAQNAVNPGAPLTQRPIKAISMAPYLDEGVMQAILRMITPAQQCDGQPQHLPGLLLIQTFKRRLVPASAGLQRAFVVKSVVRHALFLY